MSAVAPRGGVAPITRRVMNLAHFLTRNARRYPQEAAVVVGETLLDWQSLDAQVSALAHGLVAHGIVRGDRMLVHSRNCPQMIITQLACWRIGAVWCPTNFRITPQEAAYLARASGARALLVQEGFPEHARAVAEAAPELVLLAGIGAGVGVDLTVEALITAHQGKSFCDVGVEHDDPCWFFYTSGTTGYPKAAVLTHGQMGFVATSHLCDLMPGTEQSSDASLVVAPLSHGAGIHFLAQLARGVKSVLLESQRLDPAEVWRLVERHRISNLFTVPTIVNLLVEHPAVHQHDHSSLRYVIYAGAPMYREHQKQALRVLGKVLVQYFGLGEVSGNITVFPPGLHSLDDEQARVGTCGVERTGIQVSVQDEQGCELPLGETGEICVCGLAVFAGYYDNPEANASAFRQGWFRTGDLGHQDSQGFVYLTGRASDMFISGGSNIYPREIEEKLLQHPQVREVAVVGMPDERWGEVGVAAVVADTEGLTAEELLDWLKGRIADYKIPRRVVFLHELPRSGYGKITKKLVRAAIDNHPPDE